jgi:cytochrome P450
MVIVPSFGLAHELIMPESWMSWVMSQPDDTISSPHAFLDINRSVHSFGHTRYWGDAWQFHIVKTRLNGILPDIILNLNNELKRAFDTYFGTDTENWEEIDLEKTMHRIIAQAANRFIVGEPLCRNENYLNSTRAVIRGVLANALLTNCCPKLLQPLVGYLLCRPIWRNTDMFKKEFEPVYKERLDILDTGKGTTEEDPRDHLQLMLRFAETDRPGEVRDLDIIAKRVLAVNFASINQTSMTVTNLLLNIIGSDAEFHTIGMLREEIKQVTSDGTPWTKTKLSTMIRTDSVVRETMRINPFGNRTMMRKVIKDGLVAPDGTKLPKGIMFSFFSEPVQHDPDNYPEPFKFDPFRTSRVREADIDGKGSHALTVVSTSPKFLPWSHGKHACPGRFLVDHEMKMFLSYLLTNYDIDFPPEYQGQRPPPKWMAEVTFPPPGAKILIKRRKQPIGSSTAS